MSVGKDSLTPEQQKVFRKAEATFHGFRPSVPLEVVDAMGALEELILIEHADNVDEHAKKRLQDLRKAIKTKVGRGW